MDLITFGPCVCCLVSGNKPILVVVFIDRLNTENRIEARGGHKMELSGLLLVTELQVAGALDAAYSNMPFLKLLNHPNSFAGGFGPQFN